MEVIFKISVLVPVLWIIVQNILIVYAALWLLRTRGFVTTPVAGMEYSQAIISGVLLFTALIISNASAQACYDTSLTYSSQPDPWIGRTFLKYSQYFLLTVVFLFILAGLAWLTLKIFFRSGNQQEDTIQAGNLPLAIIVGGVMLGQGLGLAKLAAIVLESMTPHFVVFN